DEPQANDGSVWWSWTAPASGPVTVTTDGGFAIGVYTGLGLDSLNRVVFAAPGELSNTTRALFTARSGRTYHLAVNRIGGEFTLQIAQSAPPVVSILTPTNNSRFISGQPVTVSAHAADSDGAVARVEFYLDFEWIKS